MLIRILSLTTFFFLASCTSSATTSDQPAGPFFDVSGYFDAQIASLAEQAPTVTKTVTLDGATEEQERSDINFKFDLALFRNADINRPAWIEKYQVQANGLDTTYLAQDSSLNIQRLAVFRHADGAVRSIEISRQTGSVLSDGRQELVYTPGQGYSILGYQKSNVVGNADIQIEVTF